MWNCHIIRQNAAQSLWQLSVEIWMPILVLLSSCMIFGLLLTIWGYHQKVNINRSQNLRKKTILVMTFMMKSFELITCPGTVLEFYTKMIEKTLFEQGHFSLSFFVGVGGNIAFNSPRKHTKKGDMHRWTKRTYWGWEIQWITWAFCNSIDGIEPTWDLGPGQPKQPYQLKYSILFL